MLQNRVLRRQLDFLLDGFLKILNVHVVCLKLVSFPKVFQFLQTQELLFVQPFNTLFIFLVLFLLVVQFHFNRRLAFGRVEHLQRLLGLESFDPFC